MMKIYRRVSDRGDAQRALASLRVEREGAGGIRHRAFHETGVRQGQPHHVGEFHGLLPLVDQSARNLLGREPQREDTQEDTQIDLSLFHVFQLQFCDSRGKFNHSSFYFQMKTDYLVI
jgi:hypothetical protein